MEQDSTSVANSIFPMETSRLENSKDDVLPPKTQMHYIRLAQEVGTVACKHCPFRTSHRRSLVNHEKYHSANHPFQCNFCTFSSKSEQNLVAQHINRVHLEELKTTRNSVQPVIDKEGTNPKPTGEEQLENCLSPSKEPVEQNDAPKTAAEDEMKKGEEEVMVSAGLGVLRTLGRACREPTSWALFGAFAGLFLAILFWTSGSCLQANPALVMVREQELEEMFFLGGQPQTFGNVSAVSCTQCDDQFHEHCVYITPNVYEEMDELEGPWTCSHCLTKEAPITNETTQSQALNTSAKKDSPLPRYTKSPRLPDLSDDCLEPQRKNANESMTSETPTTLLLPTEEEVYSSERSNLLLEIDTATKLIMDMKKYLKEEDREMQMARSRAAIDLRKKMEVLENEVHSQSIHLVVLKENTVKLAEMRDDLESLVGNRGDVTRPSDIGVQLKALIDKQEIRIKRFTWLEMKLAEINYKLHLDEIRKEKERWLNRLMDYNVE